VREDTKRRFQRVLWEERLKKIGIGIAIACAIGLAFAYESLDSAVTNSQVAGTITGIDPLVTKSSVAEANGETVHVKLDNGPLVNVLALKSRHLMTGDRIQVVEHHHGSGRVTHTLK
jgi:hypothetical protein